MHRTLILQFSILLFCAVSAIAQTGPPIVLTGRVLDDSTSAPLQHADVFLANTTLGSGTDELGRFQIKNVKPGFYELVASRIGYRARSFRIVISDSSSPGFDVRLQAETLQLGEIVVPAPDPSEWKNRLGQFTRQFLGTTQNARECRITNPEVLDFEESDQGLHASARAPLDIENRALGYHIKFILNSFRLGRDSVTLFDGFARFTELEPSTSDDRLQWEDRRLRAFQGSLRHFLVSLYKKELSTNGFVIYIEDKFQSRVIPQYSLRMPSSEDDIPCDSTSKGQKTYSLKDVIRVVYGREPSEQSYILPAGFQRSVQTSWLSFTYDAVTINSNGLVKDRLFPVRASGYMAWKRMADALPVNFGPDSD